MSVPIAEPLMLRRPGLGFGLLALALLYCIALAAAAFAVGGLSGLNLDVASAYSIPAAIGTGLTALRIGPRLRRGVFPHRRDIIWRAAAAFGAIGVAWPLSYGLAVLSAGDGGSPYVLLPAIIFGFVIGVIGGALGGIAAAYACCTKRG